MLVPFDETYVMCNNRNCETYNWGWDKLVRRDRDT